MRVLSVQTPISVKKRLSEAPSRLKKCFLLNFLCSWRSHEEFLKLSLEFNSCFFCKRLGLKMIDRFFILFLPWSDKRGYYNHNNILESMNGFTKWNQTLSL